MDVQWIETIGEWSYGIVADGNGWRAIWSNGHTPPENLPINGRGDRSGMSVLYLTREAAESHVRTMIEAVRV